LVSYWDTGHCVDSVGLGDVEVVHAAVFCATGIDCFGDGWGAAEDDEHVPFLYENVMLFGDLAGRNKAIAYSRYYERWERNALAAYGKERSTDTGGARGVAVVHCDGGCWVPKSAMLARVWHHRSACASIENKG
jgi:hypothetical protein